MQFPYVIHALKDGKSVARQAWADKGLRIEPEVVDGIGRPFVLTMRVTYNRCGTTEQYVNVLWLASKEDTEADDWVICD